MDNMRLDILDAIIPIVAVIIWIISSMMNFKKKAPRQGRPASPPPQDFAPSDDPEEQLRRFLNELSGQSEDEEEPEVEPAPRAVPPPPPPRPQVVMATPPPLTPPARQEPIRVSRPEPTAPATTPADESPATSMAMPMGAAKRGPSEATNWLRAQLSNPVDVRNAVLVREVLGPPLGLRSRRD